MRPIYTGGSIAVDSSGRILAACMEEGVLISDLKTGDQLAFIEGVTFLVLSLKTWSNLGIRTESPSLICRVRTKALQSCHITDFFSESVCISSSYMLSLAFYEYICPVKIGRAFI